MSFRKIQKIDPFSISNPDAGHVYLGQDNHGLWEKDEYGNVWYIQSGNTYITVIENATTSGTSGVNGTMGSSGKDGGVGTSGTSGKSGLSGTSGTSGEGTSGSSGTSGKSGSSGTGKSGSSGTSGFSGSSGVDGIFYGSSGTSGTSGYSGGYGAATRMWVNTGYTIPNANYFFGWSDTYNSNDLGVIEYFIINKIDSDGENLYYWINSWRRGTLKIENRDNFSNFGIYSVDMIPELIGNNFKINNLVCEGSNGSLIDGDFYYISFIENGLGGSSGTSGVNGEFFGSSGNLQILRGNSIYHRQSMGIDTVGDWREWSDGSGFYVDYCSSVNPTVWTNKHTISI